MFLIYFGIPSELREFMPTFSIMTRSALAVIVLLLLISACSFAIKMVSGKPNFKNELLTGGLCAIPLTALLLVLFITSKVIVDSNIVASLAFGGFNALIQKAGVALVLVFYIVLMFINILQQSLRASGTKDIMLWYLSPACIFLSFYLTWKVMS